MHDALAGLFGIILWIVWWLVMAPVVFLASTPVILIAASFRQKPYRTAVYEMYNAVLRFAKDWGKCVALAYCCVRSVRTKSTSDVMVSWLLCWDCRLALPAFTS